MFSASLRRTSTDIAGIVVPVGVVGLASVGQQLIRDLFDEARGLLVDRAAAKE
jgi:hypothetical protein